MPSGVGSAGINNPLNDIFNRQGSEDVNGPSETGRADSKSGVFGARGQTPILAPGLNFASQITRMSNSLRQVTPDGNIVGGNRGSDIEVLIASVLDKMQTVKEAVQKNKLVLTQEKQSGTLKETGAKQEVAIEKQEQAKKENEGASIWQKISLAFQFLGAILTAVVGTILIATGAATGLGLFLLASAAVQLAVAIDSAVSQATGKSIAVHAMEAMNFDKEAIKGIDIALKVYAAVTMITMGFVSLAIPGAQAGSVAAIMSTVSNVTSMVMSVGTTLGNVAASGVTYHAGTLNADAKELLAETDDMNAFVELLGKVIDQLISVLISGGKAINDALDDTISSMNGRADVNSKNRFQG